jgi:Myb-like DNA-binding protein RAP1
MSYHSISYNEAIDVDIQAMNQTNNNNVFAGVDVKSLFTTPDGKSLMFYMERMDPQRNKYKKLLIENGGVVLDSEPTNDFSNVIYLSSVPVSSAISVQWIDDSIAQGFLGNSHLYRMMPATDVIASNAIANTNPNPRGHNRFTHEKDEFILKQIRLNPRFRNSHVFFNKLAQSEILRGHTGNSIRSRFRNHLQSQLTWVYNTDENDEVVRDKYGHKQKINLQQFNRSLKNIFTAEDDYCLCVEASKTLGINVDIDPQDNFDVDDFYDKYIKAYNDGLVASNSSINQITYSFFDKMYRKKPTHPLHSWRDRYRKYVSSDIIAAYIKYYTRCQAVGIAAKNLPRKIEYTKRPSSKQVRHELMRNQESLALDEEIGQTKSSNIDDSLLRQSEHIQPPKLVDLDLPDRQDGSDDDEIEEDDDDDQIDNFSTAKETQSMHQIEELDSKDLEVEATQQQGQNDELEVSDTQVAIERVPTHLHYVRNDIEIVDLFDLNKLNVDAEKFSERKGDYILDVKARIRECATLEEIYDKLRSIGFKDEFISHLALSTNVDTKYMSEYLEVVFNRIFNYIKKGKRTPISQELIANGQPGIWNIEYDKLLDSNEGLLLEVHSKELIRRRKKFLKDNYEIIDGFDSLDF